MIPTYGLSFLPEEAKGPSLWFLLEFFQDRITARTVLLRRKETAELEADDVFALILSATGDIDRASLAKAKFILDSTRKS